MSKQADRFERVYAQINRIKSIKGGPANREDLRGVLEKCDINLTEWGSALQYARANLPNLYENFQRSMGKVPDAGANAAPEVPPEDHALAQAQQALASGDIEVEEDEDQVTEQVAEAYSATDRHIKPDEEEVVNCSASTVLHNVITWLETLDDSERKRVMRAAQVFFE